MQNASFQRKTAVSDNTGALLGLNAICYIDSGFLDQIEVLIGAELTECLSWKIFAC